VDDRVVIEVGGKSKDSKQIEGVDNAYLAIDDIEFGVTSHFLLNIKKN
jgi:hypothetical protein